MLTRIGAVAVCMLLLVSVFHGGLARADVLSYGDGMDAGKQSFGGGGFLITYDVPHATGWLDKIEVFGSRYGTATPPDEDFNVYVLDDARHVLAEVRLPYSLWQQGAEYWQDLPIPPVKVEKVFGIGLDFHAHQTKGVFVGKHASGAARSFWWALGVDPQPRNGFNWMIRATVTDQPQGDPTARDLIVPKIGPPYFDRVVGTSADAKAISTAGHGDLPMDQVRSVRLGAGGTAKPMPAVAVLTSGLTIPCELVSLDDKALVIRDSAGNERSIPRPDVARLEFK
jgi:hypothetical protein